MTARRAFDGDTPADVLASVIERDPNWALLPGSTPRSIRRLLRRCLEKDTRNRQRDVGDARLEIEESLNAELDNASGREDAAAEVGEIPRVSRRRLTVSTVATACLVTAAIVIALLVAYPRGGPAREAEIRVVPLELSVVLPEDMELELGRSTPLTARGHRCRRPRIGRELAASRG